MRRIILYMLLLSLVSCEHKKLCYDHPHIGNINVIIHWKNHTDIPALGMRTYLDLIEGDYLIGLTDMPSDGGKIKSKINNTYRALCYDYMGGGSIYFKNELNYNDSQIYTNNASRASYTKIYPNEELIHQPENFFMDQVTHFNISELYKINELHFYPTNRVIHYTFEIRGVNGVNNISAFAGACSGISRSYYLSKETISDIPCTTLIYEVNPSKEKNTIEGEFLVFGHCLSEHIRHNFTMEIMFAPNEYKYKTWDVTEQIHKGSKHLIMDWDITIPAHGGTDMDVDIKPWDDVWIPVEM